MMSVGKQSLANSQIGLQTTSHNVANANTEGYTRQRVDFEANEPVGLGRLRIGQGAKSAAVNRAADGFLYKQIQEETAKLGTAIGKENPLGRTEQVFNESINQGLNRFLSDFFNAFREFANNPESQANRANVKETAKTLVENFHRVNSQLKAIQRDVDNQVVAQAQQINGYIREVANLNDKITFIEIQHIPANDERDRRELLRKKLSDRISIKGAEDDHGKVTVTAGNTGVLVSGNEFNELVTRATPADGEKRESNVDVFFRNGPRGSEFHITKQLKGGQIGGALEVRDKTINELHKNMDHIAYTVAEAVNAIHEAGYDQYDTTGRKFFDPLNQEFEASAYIKINDEISEDAGRIAGALQPGSPGDNRVANAIATLQDRKLLKDGTTTIDDYFNGMVGDFAVLTKKNSMVREHQKNIVDQLNNIRESISGVSLDEETTDMIKYQKAFDASARIIKVADEMFDTVLNLKRL